MEPAVAARLAVSALTPLLRKLFVVEGAGAGVVDRPVRLSGLVSFRGEKRTLGRRDLHRLSVELVRRGLTSVGAHEGPTAEVRDELAGALAESLYSVGELALDDVQAVRLGAAAFARELERPTDLSAEAEGYFDALLEAACAQILQFFTQRSTFVARTLVEQSRALGELDDKVDRLVARTPSTLAEDARFEERYAGHIARTHGELTIYGLDLAYAREWQLDAAYLTLEATDQQDAPIAADRVLAGNDRVLLRGGAGSGKTTLVQWLAVASTRQQHAYEPELAHLLGRVPFVLPLRRVIRDGRPPTPDQFLHAVRSSLAGAQPDGWADRVLSAGRAVVLVDGIDEIPANARMETRRWIRDLVRDYPGNLWLVTARPSAVDEDWLTADDFAELSLAPMSRPNVLAFVRRWHTAADAEPELADGLIASIRASNDLGTLAVNPLMCGLLCALHRERRGFLPHSRKDLYEAALSMLLERRDLERGVYRDGDLRLSREVQVQLLQKLAHWLIRNNQAEMDRADAVAQLDRALAYMADLGTDAEGVLRHLLDRSGLLREPAPGRVDFVHRTFQDYLGAKAAVEEGDFPLLLNNAHNAQWEDVLRMAVALARPAERARLLNGLLDGPHFGGAPSNDFDVPIYIALLATSCLAQATELDPTTRTRVLDLAANMIPPTNVAGARALAGIGGTLVLDLLPDPDDLPDDVARCVVVTAAHIGTDAALSVLTRYRHHRALLVRSQLTHSWYQFDTEQYAEEVIRHLDETDLYFTVHSPDHLVALQNIGGRSRIQIIYDFDPADLVDHPLRDQVTHLWLSGMNYSNLWLDRFGWDWLAALPRLETLLVRGPLDHITTPDGVTLANPPESPDSVRASE